MGDRDGNVPVARCSPERGGRPFLQRQCKLSLRDSTLLDLDIPSGVPWPPPIGPSVTSVCNMTMALFFCCPIDRTTTPRIMKNS